MREGLVLLLGTLPGIVVAGQAADGNAAVELVAAANPQVVLMDLNMPGAEGVSATRRITADHPDTRVVVLTTYADDESIIGALQAGALGYLTKDATRAEIGRAVLAAAAGQAVLDPGALFVSEATVKTHVNRILAKTGSRDRVQAMSHAYAHGYAEPAPPS